jgi:hypothetical protein
LKVRPIGTVGGRMLASVLYDAWLSRGAAERRETLDLPTVFEVGNQFRLGLEVYEVTAITEGHGPFDAVLFAELVGDAPVDAVGTAE